MEMLRIARPDVGPPEPLRPRASELEALDPMAMGRRQTYLEAFQVPAVVIGLHDGVFRMVALNDGFRKLVGTKAGDSHDLLRLMRDFLAGELPEQQLRWSEPGVAGRHFRIQLSRLAPSGSLTARALVSFIDRTAEIAAERTLRAEMLLDGLTGLPNRVAFMQAVEEAIERGDEQAGFAVLAIDLARFSRVNAGVGALYGDELILTVAHRLRATLSPDDLLARTAGDEFGVLIRLRQGAEEALLAARLLQNSFAQPVRLSDLEIKIDGAIGCAVWTPDLTSAADMLGNVQVALKRAKLSGGIEVHQPGERIVARRRFCLETRLRRAIDQDQLALAFQPLLDLDTGAVAGFEALARWTDPEHGVISPGEFIPVAEESGLVVALGRWALDRAARTLSAWDTQAQRTLPIKLSVNVSPVQLARDSVVAAVEQSGIDPSRLTLELTESTLVAEPERASMVLSALHERRCQIAMDDFGTGYSCLAYLQRLPIDVLKIDRSLVTDMHENRDSMAIVRAVLSLARALGLATVAEGIERGETASMLGALGCGIGQGYYFARPLPPEEALAYLLARAG